MKTLHSEENEICPYLENEYQHQICGVSLVSKIRSLMTESSTVPRGARNPFLVGGALRGIISPDTIQKEHYSTSIKTREPFGYNFLLKFVHFT